MKCLNVYLMVSWCSNQTNASLSNQGDVFSTIFLILYLLLSAYPFLFNFRIDLKLVVRNTKNSDPLGATEAKDIINKRDVRDALANNKITVDKVEEGLFICLHNVPVLPT